MDYYILAINPGSTSTKVGLFKNEEMVAEKVLRHPLEEIQKYGNVMDQYEMRKTACLDFLSEQNMTIKDLSAVVGRGGLMGPIESGAYAVNDAMLKRLRENPGSDHASNIASAIAKSIGDEVGIPSFIYDGVSVDEREPLGKVSGFDPNILRYTYVHTLNMKAQCRELAKQVGKKYEDMNIVVAHVGGGTSASVHKKGKIVDLASDDEGSFSTERAGRVSYRHVLNLAYSGQYTKAELNKKLRNNGGFMAYLGTNDGREVEARIKAGDEEAKFVMEAMAYMLAKTIGELSTVVKGEVDYIIFTGGLAYSNILSEMLRERVEWIAPLQVMPGENELPALALGALRVVRGEEEAKTYVDRLQ